MAPAELRIREVERIDGIAPYEPSALNAASAYLRISYAHFPKASQILLGTALRVEHTEEIPLLNNINNRMQS